MERGSKTNRLWLTLMLLSSLSALVTSEYCLSHIWWYGYTSISCSNRAGYPNLGTYEFDTFPWDRFSAPCCPATDDVEFLLYSQDSTNVYVEITLGGPKPAAFSDTRKTVFIAHGWNSYAADFVPMKDAFLSKTGLYNVILVEWNSKGSIFSYGQRAANTRTSGEYGGLMMAHLVDNWGVSAEDIWCVGHSLGGHFCGYAGRREEAETGSKIGRITGLDPAGVDFEDDTDPAPYVVGLNYNDASFVDVIHSDDTFGTTRSLGHADFFPNGGGFQYGCWTKKRRRKRGALGCSHSRAHEFFTESILTDCFVATETCTSYVNIPTPCTSCGTDCPHMGYAAQSTSSGIYYLETNSQYSGVSDSHCLQP